MNDLIKRYEHVVNETAIYPPASGLVYTTLGLTGEAGEIANKVKKIIRDNDGVMSEEVRFELMKEAGDTLWYLVAFINKELGFSLEQAMEHNMTKLLSRKERGTLQGSGDNR